MLRDHIKTSFKLKEEHLKDVMDWGGKSVPPLDLEGKSNLNHIDNIIDLESSIVDVGMCRSTATTILDLYDLEGMPPIGAFTGLPSSVSKEEVLALIRQERKRLTTATAETFERDKTAIVLWLSDIIDELGGLRNDVILKLSSLSGLNEVYKDELGKLSKTMQGMYRKAVQSAAEKYPDSRPLHQSLYRLLGGDYVGIIESIDDLVLMSDGLRGSHTDTSLTQAIELNGKSLHKQVEIHYNSYVMGGEPIDLGSALLSLESHIQTLLAQNLFLRELSTEGLQQVKLHIDSAEFDLELYEDIINYMETVKLYVLCYRTLLFDMKQLLEFLGGSMIRCLRALDVKDLRNKLKVIIDATEGT